MKTSLFHRPPWGLALLGVILALLSPGGSGEARAQGFNVGSNGELGDFVVTTSTNLTVPPDGVLHFRSLTVESGGRLGFVRNTNNTAVTVLVQTQVEIKSGGVITVSGGDRTLNSGGRGGPGGFDGGKPGFGPEVPPGAGFGPGAGKAGFNTCGDDPNGAQGGSYGTRGLGNPGNTYGSSLLIPLIGGSGGGGGDGALSGGGGGGGAILIAANDRIILNGSIQARGGFGGFCNNYGSGGAVRLVSFKVEGVGSIDTLAGNTPNRGFSREGAGRTRVDCVNLDDLRLDLSGAGVATIGNNLIAIPPSLPRLDVIQVADNNIPLGSGPVTFFLPFGSSPQRTVRVQASGFNRQVPIRVTVTPNSGVPAVVDATIDNTASNPATVEVPIVVPVNTLVTIHCWTR